ncbi:YkoF family thiamine/hydroxymethylpyrimidine-binding protein [Salinimicrobium sp. GXAS 041]|uniref:YkoF family thiamine/hydroxymethylpyrimidine-binding protein n=1 Tax=Salinimicrobium sp. GXAS 041 TaxID=3400806 RepID=UPI003C7913D9
MQISVELTLTPLQDDFEAPVKKFIRALKASGFTILENPLSTQVYGEYDKVMDFLTEEIREAFTATEHILINMKIVNSNRSDYAADF